MSDTTNHQSEHTAQVVPVHKLYMFHPLEEDGDGILITSVTNDKKENIIPLKLNHPDDFGCLRLRFFGREFDKYFPSNATVRVSEILLSTSATKYKDTPDGDWNIIKINTKQKDDCHYLFEQAVKNNYTVIIGMKLEIIDTNNSSHHLTLYRRDANRQLLLCAVREKDLEMIDILLDYKLDINIKVKEGMTPLLVAVQLGIPDVVDYLIINGANVNAQNDKHQSSLHLAAKNNNLKILNSLINNQAQLNIKDKQYQTPLFYAVTAGHVNVIDTLLKKGANYYREDSNDRTAFHLAVQQKNLEIIKVFLNNNVYADIVNSCKQTPIFYLSEDSIHPQPQVFNKKVYLDIINVLLKKGTNINHQDINGCTILHHALNKKNIELVQALLESNVDVNCGKNALHLACWCQTNECIKVLLDYNTDINAVDEDGQTVLHIAVETKNYEALELILKKKSNIKNEYSSAVELSFKIEADIDLKDLAGKTALHLAIESNDLRSITLLLEKGANVDLKDSLDRNALHLALQKCDIQIEIIESFLNYTNDIDAKDVNKRTPLHYAALNQNVSIVKWLLEKNANVNAKDSKGRTPLHLLMAWNTKCLPSIECIKLLVGHKADVNAVNNNMSTPLHYACLIKNVEAIKYLIDNGADSSMKDKDGKTVFHYACMMKMEFLKISYDQEAKILEDLIDVLVEEVVSVNFSDKYGKTPLHYIVENDCESIMNELLLNIGADINVEDKSHKTVSDKLFDHMNLIPPTNRIQQVAQLYHQHIIKIKVMNVRIREKILNKIHEVNDVYERDCNEEIDLMKICNINESNITYYDFLKRNPHDIINYAHNLDIVSAIKSDELINVFPIYRYFFTSHLHKIRRRYNLYEKIQELSKLYVFEQFPGDCWNEIFKYLNDYELYMLFEALKFAVLIK